MDERFKKIEGVDISKINDLRYLRRQMAELNHAMEESKSGLSIGNKETSGAIKALGQEIATLRSTMNQKELEIADAEVPEIKLPPRIE